MKTCICSTFYIGKAKDNRVLTLHVSGLDTQVSVPYIEKMLQLYTLTELLLSTIIISVYVYHVEVMTSM